MVLFRDQIKAELKEKKSHNVLNSTIKQTVSKLSKHVLNMTISSKKYDDTKSLLWTTEAKKDVVWDVCIKEEKLPENNNGINSDQQI